MTNQIDRGTLVYKRIIDSGMKIQEVCKRLNISRTQLSRYKQKPELDFEIISRIGLVIGYDFQNDFPEVALFRDAAMKELGTSLEPQQQIVELSKDVEKWKNEAYRLTRELMDWKDKYYNLVLKEKQSQN